MRRSSILVLAGILLAIGFAVAAAATKAKVTLYIEGATANNVLDPRDNSQRVDFYQIELDRGYLQEHGIALQRTRTEAGWMRSGTPSTALPALRRWMGLP